MQSESVVSNGGPEKLSFKIADEERKIGFESGNDFAEIPDILPDFETERGENEYEQDRTETSIAPIGFTSCEPVADADKYTHDKVFFEEGEDKASPCFRTAQIAPTVETINRYLPCFFYNDKVLLTLSLWGGKKQGESMFFSLICDDKVYYVGVIDSFMCNGEAPAVKRLKMLERKEFDFICWTHPDLDHTLGMPDILREYAGEDTLFCMPSMNGLPAPAQLKIKAREAYELLMNTLTTEDKHIGHICRVNNKMELARIQLMRKGDSRPTLMELHSFAPLDDYVLPCEAADQKLRANAYSVGIILSIGDNLHCLLGGDVENNTLEKARNNGWLFHEFQYVKVPHHGSDSSSNLPTYLQEVAAKLQVIATSAFTSHKLPKDKVLRAYHNLGAKVYMTSPLPSTDEPTNDFGVVETQFEWHADSEPICTTTLDGNAVAYVPH